jgi:lipooligosaccharide transport system ATP-binding protein
LLEFRGSHEELERLRPLVEGAADAVELTGETLLAFTGEADALTERVRASGIDVENTVYRQAGLEDVFLRLTGRRLIE